MYCHLSAFAVKTGDVRAPTPSGAAELVVPDRGALRNGLLASALATLKRGYAIAPPQPAPQSVTLRHCVSANPLRCVLHAAAPRPT
jgi:exonuclease VII large subunit